MCSYLNYPQAQYEFHISRQARDFYGFNQGLFSLNGNVILADLQAVREFTHLMNVKRDSFHFPERALKASDIHAMGLIDEILHYVIGQYKKQFDPQVFEKALNHLTDHLGEIEVDHAISKFLDLFPPLQVYQKQISLEEYMQRSTGGVPNKIIALEELLLLWLSNQNPAFAPFLELFDDTSLQQDSIYPQIIENLQVFFDTQPKYGPDNQNLIDMLRQPAIIVPHSLSGQLEFILSRWAHILDKYFIYRLLRSLDYVKEETKPIFGTGGEPTFSISDFWDLTLDLERYSSDKEWMPRLVLIAKHTYVWLDQLSQKYQHSITRLDQIPDEELDILKQWGFNGLWLIGVWERSSASQKIKVLSGNPEATASAYSIFDYCIANDLGGDEALKNLKERAWQRGIRLAADMVPNHMGIYSKWVIEHPDWFISTKQLPFPSYSFNGPNLSDDPRVGIYLEDHYYTREDAAVVFKRVDQWTGDVTYIYHGNDGTSMPWNDTAQLNYLKSEVREAVIQAILHVARMFPIIRFDAAMTLTKAHYQRLWFPEPGTGGAIPTRAGFGLTQTQFNAAMPQEFWREVVDRIAIEAPDTLLLAEAFWLLEGYFVRSLGMHRVYNSAFMNMLRDEKNADYRTLIKNTLEFDAEILKRYVNFMNNPDERTAAEQFGKGDKYFGVALMMCTLPGLPMFGHGQIEGFTEKYGMEYRRAYYNESPDNYLIQRFTDELVPLLRMRYLFAEVENFFLYDFFTPSGQVDENVFVYSNRWGDQRALIIYNNKYSDTRGWVKTSVAYTKKVYREDQAVLPGRELSQTNLTNNLSLSNDKDAFTIFRDHRTGLEYIRNNHTLHEKGLYLELGAYQYHIFIDFREVKDDKWHHYAELENYLGGRGVPNIREILREILLQPISKAFKALVNSNNLQRLVHISETIEPVQITQLKELDNIEKGIIDLLQAIKEHTQTAGDEMQIAQQARLKIVALYKSYFLDTFLDTSRSRILKTMEKHLKKVFRPYTWHILLCWTFIHSLGKILYDNIISQNQKGLSLSSSHETKNWLDEWGLNKIIEGEFNNLGFEDQQCIQAVSLLNLLIIYQDWFSLSLPTRPAQKRAYQVLKTWLSDHDLQRFLQINRFNDTLWFSKEAFEELLDMMFSIAVIQILAENDRLSEVTIRQLKAVHQLINTLQHAAEKSGYQVNRLLELVCHQV